MGQQNITIKLVNIAKNYPHFSNFMEFKKKKKKEISAKHGKVRHFPAEVIIHINILS